MTATLTDGNLQITGDSAANDFEILKTSAGIVVHGNTGTTINGGTTDFVAYATSVTTTGAITVDLGAGDDKFQIDGVTLNHHVMISGGEGNDKVGITNSTIQGDVTFRGGAGNDNFVADRTTFEGDVFAFCGAGNDLVTLTNSEAKHSLIVVGSEGNDGLNLNATKVDRWLIDYMDRGNDDVRIANGSDTRHVQLWGGGGNDVVNVDNSNVTRSFAARMGSGQDAVAFTGTVAVSHRIIVRGGAGKDSFSRGTATLPDYKIIRSEKFTVDTTLLNSRLGTGSGGLQSDAAQAKSDFVTSTFVRMATSEGNIDFELKDSDAPITVTNFLNYLSRYSDSIVHRVADMTSSHFIVQGGGFNPAAISTDAPITNEFKTSNGNVRGTLAMALPGDGHGGTSADGGTSQWFINDADNSSILDSGKYTVFGSVTGTGMTVVDAIAAMTTFNISGPLQNSALTDVPLKNYTAFTQNLTGTVTASVGSTSVTGTGTKFNTELVAGAPVQIAGVSYIVASITSATQMTLTSNVTTAATAATAKGNAAPTDAQYVKINSVTVINPV